MQIPFAGLTSRQGAAAHIPPPITLMHNSLYLTVVQTKKSTVMKIIAINPIHKGSRRHHKGALSD